MVCHVTNCQAAAVLHTLWRQSESRLWFGLDEKSILGRVRQTKHFLTEMFCVSANNQKKFLSMCTEITISWCQFLQINVICGKRGREDERLEE